MRTSCDKRSLECGESWLRWRNRVIEWFTSTRLWWLARQSLWLSTACRRRTWRLTWHGLRNPRWPCCRQYRRKRVKSTTRFLSCRSTYPGSRSICRSSGRPTMTKRSASSWITWALTPRRRPRLRWAGSASKQSTTFRTSPISTQLNSAFQSSKQSSKV